MQVTLASCTGLPEGDGDEAGLVEALRVHGLPARWQPWGDEVSADTLVVLRATWDYPDRPEEFHRWCASVPHLANDHEVVRYNLDKSYLVALAAAGVPVIPTRLVPPGEQLTPALAALDELSGDPGTADGEIVIKPAVGAGSRGAGRFTAAQADEALAHLRSLHAAGSVALVQPYQTTVDEHGETALVFFAGRYSHAFTKGPMLQGGAVDTDDLYLQEKLSAATPDEATRAVAGQALAATARELGIQVSDLLYARVDVVRGANGPLVLEVELTEPSLGFAFGGAPALERFAQAIADRAKAALS
ncbi:ATP-grasp domain-containing protein [Actinoplanes sp. RD1]|uniref:ATP-grasp domain-containing protein n=1 Tax=Actinoplanes sp. RD1 TaxID=3064538 RepID=UPI002740FB51|nr:hypothetical protein [Actinoplanes sp. RD1]